MKRQLLAVLVCVMIVSISVVSAAEKKVTIALWSIGRPIVSPDLIQRFKEANPSIDVELLEVPSGQVYDEWIKVLMAGGAAPDIFAIGDWNVREYADLGIIAPVNLQAAGYASLQQVQRDFLPGALDAFVVDNGLYGLPQEWNTILLYYNKSILAESGVAEPVFDNFSASNFMTTARKVQKFDADGTLQRAAVVSNWGHGLMATFELNAHVRSFGGSFFGPDGKIALDGAATRQAFNYLYDLVHTHKLGDASGKSFSNGTAAMRFTGPWETIQYPTIDFDVVPWTIGDKTVVPGYAWVWVLSKGSANSLEASRFMRFALVDNSEHFASYASFIHPRADFARYNIYKERPELLGFLKAAEMARYAEPAPIYNEFSATVQKLLWAAVGPQPKPDYQAIAEAVQQIESIIEKAAAR